MPARRVTAIVPEQLNITALAVLVETVPDHRRHAPFVLLARAVHIEITQPDYLAAGRGQYLTHPLIKQKLGIGVHVQWSLTFATFAKIRTGPINGRRGGIQQRD